MTPSDHALVLFAHGARDPQWAEPFEKVRDRIAAARPASPVVLAFLELMKPGLDEAVGELAAKGVSRITLVPLFMAQGGHLKEDLPEMLRAIADQHPDISFAVTPAIGEVDHILSAIAEWAEREFDKNASQ